MRSFEVTYRKAALVITFLLVLGVFSGARAQNTSKAQAGESIFKTRCVLCHGSDGKGQTQLGQQLKAADLHSAEVQKHSDAELGNIITHGQKSMPPFEGQLSNAEVQQVVAYVRQFGKKKK